ncbi:alpha/beta hydrolase [Alphaproteobacteria bacterium]|nr:alpha/beta hydrolase [Alphaproteobacteria bacterium]
MNITLNGYSTYISTGGKVPDPNKTVLIFLPGSGQTHLTFVLQTRFFAYDDYSVYAPDFPGHGLSEGNPLETIDEMAKWVAELMQVCELRSAIIIGHSQGCLVAMALAHTYSEHVEKLVLIAGALEIKVNDYLLDKSKTSLPQAIKMMTEWGHGKQGHFYTHPQPGHSLLGVGRELMMANVQNALYLDLNACNQFDASEYAKQLNLPVLCIVAENDKMTPIKLGYKLAETIADSSLVKIAQSGHMIPIEKPDEVNTAIKNFL